MPKTVNTIKNKHEHLFYLLFDILAKDHIFSCLEAV